MHSGGYVKLNLKRDSPSFRNNGISILMVSSSFDGVHFLDSSWLWSRFMFFNHLFLSFLLCMSSFVLVSLLVLVFLLHTWFNKVAELQEIVYNVVFNHQQKGVAWLQWSSLNLWQEINFVVISWFWEHF